MQRPGRSRVREPRCPGRAIWRWATKMARLATARREVRRSLDRMRGFRLLVCEPLEPRQLLGQPVAIRSGRHRTDDPGGLRVCTGRQNVWDNVTPDWYDGTRDVAWTPGDKAVFENTPGNVTVAGAVDAAMIQFQAGGWVLSPSDGNASLTAETGGTVIDVAAGFSATIATPIVDGAGPGSVTVGGPGALTLAGANTFSGGTNVTGGILDFAASTAAPCRRSPDGHVPPRGPWSAQPRSIVRPAAAATGATPPGNWAAQDGPAVPWIDGSDAVISGSDLTITLSGPVYADSVTFTDDGCTVGGDTLTTSAVDVETGTATINAVVAGSGGLFVTGPGTLVLAADATNTGGTTVDYGTTLQLGTGGTAGSVVGDTNDGITDNGSLIFDHSNQISYSGVISGSGNVVVEGIGTLTLTGSNTFTGGTQICGTGTANPLQPTLVFASPSAMPTTGIITVSRPGTVDLTGLSGYLDGSQSSQTTDTGGGLTTTQTGGSGLSTQQTGGTGQTTGPTQLLYDLQAADVTDGSGEDLDYDSSGNYTGVYTISPDGKTVTLNSANAIPAGRDGPDEYLRRRAGRQ